MSGSSGCLPPIGRRRCSGSFGLYYDQNHWNFTDIYLNETLLALRRVNLNANTQANNPFWTPANTAVGIAQMRAFLARNYPGYPDLSGLPFPGETILGVAPDYKIPYAANSSVGITRDVREPAVAESRLRPHAAHTTRASGPTRTGSRTRMARSRGATCATETSRSSTNGGFIKYDGLLARAELPCLGHGPRRTVLHACPRRRSNMSTGLSTGGVTNPFDLNEDLGPDDNDRRHNVVVDGSYVIPKVDVQAAGIASYRSAVPYSVSTSFQLDTDPFSDRPEPRNSRRGDKESTFDLRVSKIFRFGGRYTATAFWEMFNVFNVDNWLRYQGSLQSSTFGLPLTEAPKRRQQLGFRFDF